jgi:hypothetical protein
MDPSWKKVEDDSGDRLNWSELADGTMIEAIFRGLENRRSSTGSYTVALLEIDGQRREASAGTILVKRLGRIPAGTPIGILYHGLVKAANGENTYRSFDVFRPADVELLPRSTVITKATEPETDDVPF